MNTQGSSIRHQGGCMCGAVRYRLEGELRPVIYCHCEQCRRSSGHHVAATAVRKSRFTIVDSTGLAWFRSSTDARRGFCRECGSSLFFEPLTDDRISIMAGTIDLPTGLEAAAHIFVEERADYYAVTDGVPQVDGDAHDVAMPG